MSDRVIPDTLVLPPRTILKAGAVAGLLAECRAFGRRGVLVYGASWQRGGGLERVVGAAPDRSLLLWRHAGGEPTLDQVEALLAAARGHGAEWVAAVGGGSVLDLAKSCAGLLEAPLPLQAYHDGAPIETSRIPFVAVPTTAGTGAEATIVCVLTNTATGVKKSIRHPSFMARLVVLDPELLAACPPRVCAASGMDAFTQAVESYLSKGATWFSDACALKAVGLIDASLELVCAGQGGTAARDLLLGSYLAGLALSNARLGLVHGLAHPLGARFHVPHGLVCAVCLPAVLAFNRPACAARFAELAGVLGRDVEERARALNASLGLVSPFAGLVLEDVDAIVAETLASGSTAANPRPVADADVRQLLAGICAPCTTAA